jgi:signal transduction histidine kinase
MDYQSLLHSPLLPTPLARLIEKLGASRTPVLIQGERGTGKELVARIIHSATEDPGARFLKADCRTGLKGPFLDRFAFLMDEERCGSRPWTLYLDEVDCLSAEDQRILLDWVEQTLFQPLSESLSGRGRFVASSTSNLRDKVSAGAFSDELAFRLDSFPLHLPPLRDRIAEIERIGQYILSEYADRMRLRKVGFTPEAIKVLQNHAWPGNLTELEQVLVRGAILSDGQDLTDKDLHLDRGRFPLSTSPPSGDAPSQGLSSKETLPKEEDSRLLPFFVELIHRIKNPLVSVKTFTQLLREKFDDPEYRDYFYRIVTEDIEKIDVVLNGLLNFVKVNSPVPRGNTVHVLLDEIMQGYENQIEGRKIRVIRKLEKDLPDAVLHDEQLRYIFNAILQYALPFVPPSGSIGLLTKSLRSQNGEAASEFSSDQSRNYIEVLMVFSGSHRPMEQYGNLLGLPGEGEGEPVDLELRLVREIIQKHQGVMRLEFDDKKPKTTIALRFPADRRRKVLYQPPGTGA